MVPHATWLCQHPDNWPIEPSTASPTNDTIINSETRRAVLLISTEDAVDLDRVINKFSSLSKIENIVAYLLRFANNCRVSNSTRRSGPITKNEHVAALKILVKHVQRSSFLDICQKLKTNQACPKSIQRLAPFSMKMKSFVSEVASPTPDCVLTKNTPRCFLDRIVLLGS
jgi:hypothetical protein